MSKKSVLFSDALPIVLEILKQSGPIADEITIIRDLRGRIRLLFPGKKPNNKGEKGKKLDTLCRKLSESLGKYGFSNESMALFCDDFSLEKGLIESERRLLKQGKNVSIFLLDRQITGQDWLQKPFKQKTSNHRVTFFGIKGGVGRSTALIIWAWRLAKQGKKVLIFDLDLESPGISSTLLPPAAISDFGIVDWFVEDGIGQAEIIEPEMIAASPLSSGLAGEIKIVPAFGSKTHDYLPKLARCYADVPGGKVLSWSTRLERLVTSLENAEKPDIVILDSRAGIHDIAAVAVTRLQSQSFLFAVDSPQTWKAYDFLFHYWRQHPQLNEIREQLQIVASMIPETGREEYLKRFREHSWDVFREHLYDETGPNPADVFSFDLNEDGSPHDPLPLFWHRALQEFDPVGTRSGMDEKIAEEAMGEFIKKAENLVFNFGEDNK